MKTKRSKAMVMLSLTFLFISVGMLNAQDTKDFHKGEQDKKDRINAMKVAFISEAIDLNTAEAQNFWPLYNEFQDKRDALQKGIRDKMKQLKDIKVENLTEEQADEVINLELQKEQNQLDLKKEYYPKFKKVIGSKKVVGIYRAEKEFNRLLLEKLKGDRPKPGMDN